MDNYGSEKKARSGSVIPSHLPPSLGPGKEIAMSCISSKNSEFWQAKPSATRPTWAKLDALVTRRSISFWCRAIDGFWDTKGQKMKPFWSRKSLSFCRSFFTDLLASKRSLEGRCFMFQMGILSKWLTRFAEYFGNRDWSTRRKTHKQCGRNPRFIPPMIRTSSRINPTEEIIIATRMMSGASGVLRSLDFHWKSQFPEI